MQFKDLPLNPSPKMLRQFAGLCLAIFGLLAAWQWYKGNTTWAYIFGALALLGPIGLAYPPALRPIFVGWMILVFPIGWLLNKILMGLLFYGLFTIIGFMFRLVGRDPLSLKPHKEKTTYFVPKPQTADLRAYFRQF